MDARAPEPVVDLWVGVSTEVAAVDEAMTAARQKMDVVPIGLVMSAFEQRQVVGLKIACEAVNDAAAEIRRLVTQAENMSAHLAKILTFHANRRPHP